MTTATDSLRSKLRECRKSARYHRNYICETERQERAHASARRVAIECALKVRAQLRLSLAATIPAPASEAA